MPAESEGVPHALWVTRQALADIGFEALAGPTFDLAVYAQRHPILGRFLDQRSENTVGTQKTQGVQATGREIYNLHAQNPTRGVTWFDETNNVVFLLAVSLDHNYHLFVDRAEAGELMPTAQDYADLAAHRDPLYGLDDPDFFELARPDADELLLEVLQHPGVLVERMLGHELPSAMQLEVVVVDDTEVTGDVYAAVRFGDRLGNVTLPSTIHTDVAVLLFPDAQFDEVDMGYGDFPAPRGKLQGDVVIRWRRT